MTVTKGNLLEIKRNKTALLSEGDLDHVDHVKDNVFDLVLLCPFISDDDVDFYSYKLPTMLLLAVNSFFLFWIMGVSVWRGIGWSSQLHYSQIVLSKLHSQTAMDHDRRHLKAAKALVIVIPLFGFTNILTIMGPSDVGLYFCKMYLVANLSSSVSHRSISSLNATLSARPTTRLLSPSSSPSGRPSSPPRGRWSRCPTATATLRSAAPCRPGTVLPHAFLTQKIICCPSPTSL